MTHTPIRQGELLTCADCAWRVIVTNRGPFIRDPGDPAVDHMALLDAQKAQAERLLRRLHEQWRNQTPLPEADDNCDDLVAAGVRDARTLTMRQARLYGLYIKRELGV